MKNKGSIIIISSPSGAGKTSITKNLLACNSNLQLSVSVTTRKKRKGEIHGKDYFFVNEDEFRKLRQEARLLEDALVFDNYYGTPKDFVQEKISQGIDVLFDIDWQGAKVLSNLRTFNIISIFILPPSIEALALRLKTRGLDSEEIINNRMNRAKEEIIHYSEYNHVIVNEDLMHTTKEIMAILAGERENQYQSDKYNNFIEDLLKQ